MRVLLAVLLFPLVLLAHGSFGQQDPGINFQTGALDFETVDWIVPGREPIVLSRRYEGRASSWFFFAHTVFKKEEELVLLEPNGSQVRYLKKGKKERFERLDGREKKGDLYIAENQSRLFDEGEDLPITVFLSDGTVRYYEKQKGLYCLLLERLPNGNKKRFTYDKKHRITLIETLCPSQATGYASVSIAYRRDEEMILTGSDQTRVVYAFEKMGGKRQLVSVSILGEEVERCKYKQVGDFYRLTRRTFSDGRDLDIRYQDGPVVSQILSKGGSERILYTCSKKGKGGAVCHTLIEEDGSKMLTFSDTLPFRIERYAPDGTLLYKKEMKHEKGLVQEEALFEGSGALVYRRRFFYGKGGLLEREETLAHFEGPEMTLHERLFSYDERGRLIQERDGALVTGYEYVGSYRLLSSKQVGDGKGIDRRQTFSYDENLFLLSEKEACHEKRYRYNPKGELEWIEERSGDGELLRSIKKTYTNSRLTKEEHFDPDQKLLYKLLFEYDWKGRLIAKTDPIGRKAHFIYNDRGLLIEEKDFVSRTPKKIHYDRENRPMTIETDGFKLCFTYGPKDQKLSSSHPSGANCSFAYDPLGRLTSVCLPDVLPAEKRYDLLGHETVDVAPSGEVTRKKNTLAGKPYEILYPDGTKVQHTYRVDGLIKTTRLEDGTWIEFDYDFWGRLTKKRASGQQEHWVYDDLHLIEYKEASGLVHLYEYDPAGRKTKETLRAPNGEERHLFFTYNRQGLLASSSLGGLFAYFSYDAAGRKIEEKSLGVTTRTEYDQADQVIAICRGHIKEEFAYDLQGRLVHHVDGEQRITHIEYIDQVPAQKITTKPEGTKVIETYNTSGLLIERATHYPLHQDPKREFFSYDRAGRPAHESYDARGRITSIGSDISYTYDARGRLQSSIRPGEHLTHYTYHPSGNLATLSAKEGPFLLHYRYDPTGHSTPLPSTYNGFGELTSETFGLRFTLHKTYDQAGRVTSLILPDGSSIHYLYDPERLEAIQRKDRKGKTLYTHQILSRTPDGKIAQEQLASCHLIQETPPPLHPFGPLTSDGFHTYTYDTQENRTSQDGQPYLLDGFRLLQAGKHTLRYDPQGRPTQIDDLALSYDPIGRLIAAKRGNEAIFYTYDNSGRRLTETFKSRTRYFLYDGEKEIGALAEDGTLLELRILNPERPHDRASAVAIEIDGTPYVPFHDPYGNIVALHTLSGVRVAQYAYTPFGERLPAQASIQSPYLFASKRYDPFTGLVFFGSRYYLPSFGRFLTPDPLYPSDGPGLYTFVHNNPLTAYDPYGLFSVGLFDFNIRIDYQSPYGTFSLGTDSPLAQALLLNSGQLIGGLIEHASFHLLPPIPFLRTGIRLFGRFLQLQFDPLPHPTPFCHILNSPIVSFDEKAVIIFANGLLNSKEDADESSQIIEWKTGLRTFSLFTPTQGFLTDLIDALFLHFGLPTPNAIHFQKQLQKLLDEIPKATQVFLILHSKAAALGNYALRRISSSYQKRITRVIALAPQRLIRNDLGFDVINYVSKADAIPFLDLFGMILGPCKNVVDITFLDPIHAFFPFNHSILSETYMQALTQIIEEIAPK
jgi:RHS repeat-associated protein